MRANTISSRSVRYPVDKVIPQGPLADDTNSHVRWMRDWRLKYASDFPSPWKRPSVAWAFAHPDKCRFGIWSNLDFCNLGTLVDDYGYSATGHNAQLWAFGQEYGYLRLVHCQHEGDGYQAYHDTMPTIDHDEVHEAYNVFDKLVEYMESKGYENTLQLRDFANRWCKTYFEIATYNANETGAWPLDESYHYQSNSSGTGIVNVGHNEHMRQVAWGDLVILKAHGKIV